MREHSDALLGLNISGMYPSVTPNLKSSISTHEAHETPTEVKGPQPNRKGSLTHTVRVPGQKWPLSD